MKKNLQTIFSLAVFAFEGILFQVSCSNSDRPAEATTTLQSKFIYILQGAGGEFKQYGLVTMMARIKLKYR